MVTRGVRRCPMSLRSWLEERFALRIRRGWYPRGESLDFDLDMVMGSARARTILDVGANLGDLTVHFLRRFPGARVFAFEPHPENVVQLRSRVGCVDGVTVVEAAVGAEAARLSLFVREGTVNHSLVESEVDEVRGVLTVDVVSLDDFTGHHGIDTVDLLKVDVEGAELAVLDGAESILSRGRVRAVQIEVGFGAFNSKHVPFARIDERMRALEMELFGIYDQRREFTGNRALRRAECLYVSSRIDLWPNGYAFPDQ